MLCLILLIVPALCVGDRLYLQRNQARIVNGQTAAAGEFPYMASLQTSSGHICGGSLIASNWVLTAAHCINANLEKVVINTVSLSNYGTSATEHSISSIIRHPDFMDSTYPGAYPNDIGLVKLATPASASKVNLPFNENNDFAGQLATILGWGDTTDGYSNELQKYSGTVLSRQQCSNSWTSDIVSDAHICISGNGGACHGDNGGPMIVGGTLVGVSTFGPASCSGKPSVYTRLTEYMPWIVTTMTEN